MSQEGKYLKDLQTTKTGFAISVVKGEERTLETFILKISEDFGPTATVEKSVEWETIRVGNVIQNITTLGQDNVPTRVGITKGDIVKALEEETGSAPIDAFETKNSVASTHELTATWMVKYPIGSFSKTTNLRLFGKHVTARVLKKRVLTVQFGRCFKWHNERTCAQTQRCRLCGSTEHKETERNLHNNVTDHCHTRCIHCLGPHPADDPKCPLRRHPNRAQVTKTERAEIRKKGRRGDGEEGKQDRP